jgi:hypothetical protein
MPLPNLETPIGSNFLKDFPATNAVNLDDIDAYSGPSLITHNLQSWTPILTATTTNPTLGPDGFIRGKFYQIFDQIFAWGEFRFGTSGTSEGVGDWLMTIPFPAFSKIGFSTNLGGAPIVGNGTTWKELSATGRMPITCHLRSSTQMFFGIRFNSGLGVRQVGQGSPAGWANQDGLNWYMQYQRA